MTLYKTSPVITGQYVNDKNTTQNGISSPQSTSSSSGNTAGCTAGVTFLSLLAGLEDGGFGAGLCPVLNRRLFCLTTAAQHLHRAIHIHYHFG
ncbi:hypothetical protein Xets_02624 [Xenorhabdus sp. TS4]|nr:hypothetical protein [Xenorhabdus sp. TS4]